MALSNVAVAGVDLPALRQLGVKFLSIAAAAFDAGFGAASAWRDFIQYARAMQFQIIVTGIHSAQQASAATTIVRFGYGPFFAPPRKVKQRRRRCARTASGQRSLTDAAMRSLSERYPVWFCDVWGVVHNGHVPFAASVSTLARHRANGGTVILVTNSPRSRQGVEIQLREIGVAPESHDLVVTSGDVTRACIDEARAGASSFISARRAITRSIDGTRRQPRDPRSGALRALHRPLRRH